MAARIGMLSVLLLLLLLGVASNSARAAVTIPLIGNMSFALFAMEVDLGMPAQRLVVQADTGSSDLAVYTAGCHNCGPAVQRFNPAASSSFQVEPCSSTSLKCGGCWPANQGCGYNLTYGDGSWVAGYVAGDHGSVHGLSAPFVEFGCIEDAFFNFEPRGVDGIVGLAFRTLSEWQGTPFFNAIAGANNLRNAFGMCLVDNAASITFGTNYHTDTRFQWTALTDDLYYVIYVADMQLNGVSFQIPPTQYGVSIVDSGTTLMVLPTQIFSAFQNMLSSWATKNGYSSAVASLLQNECAYLSASDLAQFPKLTVVLGQSNPISLTIDGNTYLAEMCGHPGLYGLGIVGQDGLGTILGDTFMRAFNVAFDRADNSIGFGPLSSCPNTKQ